MPENSEEDVLRRAPGLMSSTHQRKTGSRAGPWPRSQDDSHPALRSNLASGSQTTRPCQVELSCMLTQPLRLHMNELDHSGIS